MARNFKDIFLKFFDTTSVCVLHYMQKMVHFHLHFYIFHVTGTAQKRKAFSPFPISSFPPPHCKAWLKYVYVW